MRTGLTSGGSGKIEEFDSTGSLGFAQCLADQHRFALRVQTAPAEMMSENERAGCDARLDRVKYLCWGG